MKRKAVSGIVLMLLLTSMLSSAFIIQPVKSEPRENFGVVLPDNMMYRLKDHRKIRVFEGFPGPIAVGGMVVTEYPYSNSASLVTGLWSPCPWDSGPIYIYNYSDDSTRNLTFYAPPPSSGGGYFPGTITSVQKDDRTYLFTASRYEGCRSWYHFEGENISWPFSAVIDYPDFANITSLNLVLPAAELGYSLGQELLIERSWCLDGYNIYGYGAVGGYKYLYFVNLADPEFLDVATPHNVFPTKEIPWDAPIEWGGFYSKISENVLLHVRSASDEDNYVFYDLANDTWKVFTAKAGHVIWHRKEVDYLYLLEQYASPYRYMFNRVNLTALNNLETLSTNPIDTLWEMTFHRDYANYFPVLMVKDNRLYAFEGSTGYSTVWGPILDSVSTYELMTGEVVATQNVNIKLPYPHSSLRNVQYPFLNVNTIYGSFIVDLDRDLIHAINLTDIVSCITQEPSLSLSEYSYYSFFLTDYTPSEMNIIGLIYDYTNRSAYLTSIGITVYPPTPPPEVPDNFADLGNLTDETTHNLQGWGVAQGPPENPYVSPSGDRTKRYQLLRGDNSVDLMVDEADAPYFLTAEVEDGICTDNFEIYVNGEGPIYEYIGKNVGTGPVTAVSHQVLVPAEYITARRVTITFRNTATDDCGLAAVYNVGLTPTPPNQPPDPPTLLNQCRTDGTEISVGEITVEDSVAFKGVVSDPDGDQVKLQVELRRLGEYGGEFDETKGGFKNSSWVKSGSEATAYAFELIDGEYHWRARTVDEHEKKGNWADFGENSIYWRDFAVDTTPPETYILYWPSGTIHDNDVTFTCHGWDAVTPFYELRYSYYLEGDDSDWSDWTYSAQRSYTDLPNGKYTFKVKTKDHADHVDPTPEERSFTVSITEPHIDRITPPSGAPGIQVTIRGLNFEDVSYVYFGAERAWEIVMQSDTEIVVEVPPPHGYPPARGEETVNVVVRETYFGEDSNAVEFTYNEPHLDSIEPEVGEIGTEVTIVGKDFGFDQEYTGHIVKFGCTFQEAEDVPTWTDTKIVAKAPDDYGTGEKNRKIIKWLIWLASLGDTRFDIPKGMLDAVLRLLQGCPLLDAEPAGGKIEVGVVVETPVGTSNAAVFTYDLSTTIFVTKNSPGELRVYDSAGRVTGLVNGAVKEEIPHSLFDGDTVVIVSPRDSYRYEVVSTEEGTYGLEVILAENGEATVFNATGIPTSANTTHQYSIDWDALSLGEEGVTVQVDSDGDGIFEQTITADNELTHDEFMLQTATTIDFDPDTLNLKSEGNVVTVYIELPEGYDVSGIDVSSIRLNGMVPTLAKPTEIGDYDGDGILDLMVKFDRASVIALFAEKAVPGNYMIEVTGTWAGIRFEGTVTIRVISPP